MNHRRYVGKTPLVDVVKQMSSTMREILTGGDDSQRISEGSTPVSAAVLPIVKQKTDHAGSRSSTTSWLGAAQFANGRKMPMSVLRNLQGVDGLYLMIAEEETRDPQEPLGQSKILQSVFGALNP
jgi:hypothetical protein